MTKFWKIGQNAQVEEIVMIFTCLVQYSSGAGLPCSAVQLSTADWPAFTSTFGEVTDTTGATAINVLFVLECKKTDYSNKNLYNDNNNNDNDNDNNNDNNNQNNNNEYNNSNYFDDVIIPLILIWIK